ncbi:glycosyltransferase family 4 protein [Mycobacterium sp. IDR2000157661]|uniref:glycosyltransferase family 4 protein n=1 Tax=Mycobacterium sp. IDR2000157661 TaxID=2867005 RepID=UPI001EEB9235|nr:glycosyltransferase family 4 protein [Mycobacterium sp. IDR2000157661]ULE33962.1 glycosyltransferase family 4 protein [Mycobacterium sp. IDR2000157661]
MTLVVHDFAGHPGQLQLSRELARRGHVVEHHYCSSVATGQGATDRRPDDPSSFSILGIGLKKEFARYSPVRRISQEFKYSWLSVRAIFAAHPDAVIFANVPVIPLLIIVIALRLRRIPYISWWQDVYSEAVGTAARRKLGSVGAAIGWLADRMESAVARNAAAIIPIADAFVERLRTWNIANEKVRVIPNWGALDEVPVRPRTNLWSKAHGLCDSTVVMYAGTLGLKHDPSRIAELAHAVSDDCRIVVVSQGKGREWLEESCRDTDKLVLLDYQPYEQLPDMLASADVFLALLESDASRYSVPSKILNYLCAGRPVLALLPLDNAAAQTIEHAGAGIVRRPGDAEGAKSSLLRLIARPDLRHKLGSNGRRYAERVFHIENICDRFEEVILYAAGLGDPLHKELEPAELADETSTTTLAMDE